MNAPLRFNEALLITGRAFQPYRCVAWSEPGSDSGLNLSVVDRTGSRLLGRTRIPNSAYCDPEQLAGLLRQAREELSHNGYNLLEWSMPSQD